MQSRKKIVILGQSGVGKTSITNRYAVPDFIFENTQPTLGFLFHKKKQMLKNGNQVTLNIWDTAGQQRYRSIAKIYYKDAHVILVIFDVTNIHSFQQLQHWLQQVQNNSPENVRIIVVGNKIDLLKQTSDPEETKDEVSYNTAEQFCKNMQIQLKLVSAKEDKGIKELFETAAEDKPFREKVQKEQKPNKNRTSQQNPSKQEPIRSKRQLNEQARPKKQERLRLSQNNNGKKTRGTSCC